jgi:hypothetical protein
VSRASERQALVPDRGSAKCPACGGFVEFRTDRFGRMMEQCGCGHHAFVERRSGKRDTDATPESRN